VPEAAAEKLISLANESGGVDNVTVIVVRFEDDSNKGWFSWMRRGGAKKD
jgi:serine/threonine protein phosphatase PrpC